MAVANSNGGPKAVGAGALEGLRGLNNNSPAGRTQGADADPAFRRTLEQISGTMFPNGTAQPAKTGNAASALQQGIEKLKFSNHAIERMRSRGISYAPETMAAIENGVAKAAAKGSKDTLVLTGESALIVSVKNNTVVTVMDRAGMKENVFTNIDSTVVV